MTLLPDERSGCWRQHAPDARALLEHPELLVRPTSEPVPAPLQGTTMGWLWARWARMNDGPRHAALRSTIDAVIADWTEASIVAATRSAAAILLTGALDDPGVDRLLDLLPGLALAELLGLDASVRLPAALATRALVKGTAPQATRAELEAGEQAARALVEAVRSQRSDEDGVASRIAVLWQGSDSLAALLGNALVAATCPGVPSGPPIAITRRFTPRPLTVDGTELPRHAPILVKLAPDTAYGAGVHACPGRRLAELIAETAVPLILAARERWPATPPPLRPSPNARIPHFAGREPR